MIKSNTTKADINMPNKVERSGKSEDKEEKVTNILFGGMIVLTFTGTFLMIQKMNLLKSELAERNSSYELPKFSDLFGALIATCVLIVIKILIERITRPLAEMLVASKYKNPQDEANFALGRIYVKKNSTNFFKFFFFLSMVFIGYKILSPLEYFPVALGGNGQLSNMFKGFPDTFFHYKPPYFDFYYLTALGFCITDFIWLVFIYELQSDFILMLLHHTCTISLITFSYLSNWSNIGCIVLFLHDLADIFVYITRLFVNSEVKGSIKLSLGGLLLVVFIYTRLYVLATVIMALVRGVTWEAYCPETCLTIFLCFLYIMHINWVYQIIKKLLQGVLYNKIEDPAHVKKVSKSS